MGITLKPCPFCGNDLMERDPEEHLGQVDAMCTLESVHCSNFFSKKGCSAEVTGFTREEAIEEWNMRVHN